MNAQIQPIAELNRRATNALVREVGIVNTLRFLNTRYLGVTKGGAAFPLRHVHSTILSILRKHASRCQVAMYCGQIS